jgi:hypothetical protein
VCDRGPGRRYNWRYCLDEFQIVVIDSVDHANVGGRRFRKEPEADQDLLR